MKNIVRWTVGDVSEEGLECLKRSACNFIKFYKNQFEYFICLKPITTLIIEFEIFKLSY